MEIKLIYVCLFLWCLNCNVSLAEESGKKGKVFSLFNIVTFKNEICNVPNKGGVTSRSGICMTSSECTTKGGAPSGDCAAGFGTCCLFVVAANDGNVTQNATYVRNPGFPSTYALASPVTYTINRTDTSICQLRLDFETFAIQGPPTTTSSNVTNNGCMDIFTVHDLVSDNPLTDIICGSNTGQHIYVDFETAGVSLKFVFASGTAQRSWEIQVSQIPCLASYRAPDGCLQYYTGSSSGRITTFNYAPGVGAGPIHLPDQDYNICIRKEEGMCCVRYFPCQDTTDSFTISLNSPTTAGTSEKCTNDYVFIEGGTSNCKPGAITNRFCGSFFNTVQGASFNNQVCDCSAPFIVGIVTDNSTALITTVNGTVRERGACLEYRQQPCGV